MDITYYIKAFAKLRVDRTHGIAPHKPILLLSILQAYQNNLIPDKRIYITPELVGLFKSNWSILVTSDHNCRISYPFYYLKTSKFWKLIPKQGFENIDKMGSIMSSFTSLKAAVDYALIDADLFNLMKVQDTNILLQQVLLDTYFPATKTNFTNSTTIQKELFENIENKILREDAAEYKKEIEQLLKNDDEEEIFLRGSLFKREIPKIYNSTCCISGMRIDSTISISMIDACHIVPFSESHDDTITNGIALCPNLHRAFDRGLIAVSDEYRVIISKAFKEDESNYGIKKFENLQIRLPKDQRYYPLLKNFESHRVKFDTILSGK